MKAEKRKKVPSYIYQKSKMPDYQSSPDITKKKMKLLNTSVENGSRVVDTLTPADDGDESIALTQINVSGDQDNRTTSTNDLSFIGTMNFEEVNDHIQKCLEMSSENKITPKNAFALQLIDCMNLLLKKEDFSVMACTLDAGQKIYAHRVDGLHQQVIKLAEEIINSHKNKKKSDKDEGGEENEERLGKEKRKTLKKNILASSESLRRTLKSKDPKEKYIKIDGLPGAIISSVKRDPKDLSFTLQNSVQFWNDWENYKPLKIDGTVTIPHCEIYRDKNKIRKNENLLGISPETENTNVNYSVIESAEGSSGEMLVDDLLLNDTSSEVGADDEKSNEDEVDVISNAIKRLNDEARENKEICSVPSRLETMKMIFNQVSDYHYLNMEKAYYWAGPEFWKRSKNTGEGVEKKRIMRKKKDPNSISYSGTVADERINKNLKKAATLNKKTITGWKTKNVTYARDLRISVKQFLDLYNISDFFEVPESPESSEKDNIFESESNCNNNSTLEDGIITDYSDSQDPLNSSFYENAPEDSSSPEPRDPLNSAFYDAGLTQKPEVVTEEGKIVKVHFSATNNSETCLVPAPKIIKFQPIKHKTKPIRVDMRHLKQTMWMVINENNDKEQVDESWNDDEPSAGTKFSNVLKELPSRLEKRTAEDLFPGMALLALLTLANENNLQLKNSEDYSDVMISLPNTNSVDY